jgi:hypothetical protein
MAWTTPRTWVASELVGATLMTTHVRDNLNALKDPPTFETAYTSGSTLILSSTASVLTALSTGLTGAITTNGGAVMAYFQAQIAADAATTRRMGFDWSVDGTETRAAYAYGQGRYNITNTTAVSGTMMSFGPTLITGLTAGTHTFTPLWSISQGTAFAYANTNTTPIYMWVREVS